MSTFGQEGLARELYREGCPREVRMYIANGEAGGGKPGLELPDLTVTLFPVPCWIPYLAKTIQMQIREGRGTFGTVHAGQLQSTERGRACEGQWGNRRHPVHLPTPFLE